MDGKQLPGQTVTLQVRGPEDQDLAILEITADRTSVYPARPFTISLAIAVKELPDDHPSSGGPVEVLRVPPLLSIPWAADNQLADGLKPESDWQRWLSPLRTDTGGFTINNIVGERRSIFSFDETLARFSPPGRRIRRMVKGGKAEGYREYVLQRNFTASKVGQYVFGPVQLKGFLARDLERGEEVYAVAKPVTVTVKDAPAEGRPDSYIGAIGRFQLEAALRPAGEGG